MNYIRTKDTVCVLTREPDSKLIAVCTNKGWVYKDEILKQADTIEELCDEIIFILEGSPIPYSAPYQYDKERKMEWFKTETEIDIGFGIMEKIKEKYLAIWTYVSNKPTLKSVAKLNEKGELELL